ncbi:MAG TPA: metallophosphoesterase [Acidobacteriota bacterium]|nr:metallophosphoesterase [Acidobacteriota bacterium]
MTTLAHISDLHFGAEDPEAIEALLEDLSSQPPDLVIVSGDLTQRARRAQFQAAAAFLQAVPADVLVVPGNHDISLHNPIRRFLRPLRRYRRYISEDLQPACRVGKAAVVGINSARSLTFKGGRVSRSQIEAVARFLARQPREVCRVVVTHHQFVVSAEHDPPGAVGRSLMALEVFREQRVDLILGGHAHRAESSRLHQHLPHHDHPTVVAHAGTATSKRLRGQSNSYNRILISDSEIEIQIRRLQSSAFQSSGSRTFARG